MKTKEKDGNIKWLYNIEENHQKIKNDIPGGPKKTEWPTSAILMQKPITPSDRTSFQKKNDTKIV